MIDESDVRRSHVEMKIAKYKNYVDIKNIKNLMLCRPTI